MVLDLRENGELPEGFPDGLLRSIDARAVLGAYRSYLASEADDDLELLNESKLVLVGRESVGKTSLVQFLTKGIPRDVDEDKTIGIQKSPWRPTGPDGPLVNIWDFGGQEIQYQMHRAFLTDAACT